MRTRITTLLFLIIFLTSCSDEVKLSKDLDGTWNIETIEAEVYTTTPNETRIFNDVGTISFDHCSRRDRKNTANNSCLGSYNMALNGENFIGTFTFSTNVEIDNSTSELTEYEWVNIGSGENTIYPSTFDFAVLGSWKIESLEKKSCILAKQHSGGFQRVYLKK